MNLHMTRRKALALLAIGIAFLCSSWGVGENDRPNILVIIADDCTHNDLALYGGQNAKTPRIDTFARESLVFNKAYVSEAMCQPCRSECTRVSIQFEMELRGIIRAVDWIRKRCRISWETWAIELGSRGKCM